MKTKERPNKSYESGLTLIALIIMIIIIVILSAITIRRVTGNTGIINTTKGATEEYKIEEYKEQVTELRENVIAEYSIMGKDVAMSGIAERMAEEDTWIKSANANLEQEDTNDDIIVTTLDGYMYQIYYDELTGQKFIEYVGKGGEGSLPNVKAEYDKDTEQLSLTAKDSNGIEKVEIMHRGTMYTDNKTDETETSIDGNGQTLIGTTLKISNMGWYIVKVTSNNGYYRYAWVRTTK